MLLSGFGGELRQACTFLSHMYLTQFFFHLVLCVFMFATWPQHTFFWYILWMNACVCFVQFFHIFVYNSWYYKGIDGAFVPREMVLKDHVKRQILYWALFGIYFTIFLFNTFPWWVFRLLVLTVVIKSVFQVCEISVREGFRQSFRKDGCRHVQRPSRKNRHFGFSRWRRGTTGRFRSYTIRRVSATTTKLYVLN